MTALKATDRTFRDRLVGGSFSPMREVLSAALKAGLRLRRRELLLTESLIACDVGGMLLVKLLGFIEDQQAELLDVSEERLQLRVGRTRWERWWHGLRGHDPLEITLDISRAGAGRLNAHQTTHPQQSRIAVSIRPLTPGWSPALFQTHAERLVHRLRRYLLAS